jgi:hypothetical protein
MHPMKASWLDDENFVVVLIISGKLLVTFTFPIRELATGASLQMLMRARLAHTLEHSGRIVDAEALRESARAAMLPLREMIEAYFKIHGTEAED